MSPWLFSIFYRVIRWVKEWATERRVELRDGIGRGWEIKHVLYSSDAEIREYIQHIVSEFERACERMGLKINVGKSNVLGVKKVQM